MSRTINRIFGLSIVLTMACAGEQPERPDPIELTEDTLRIEESEPGTAEAQVDEPEFYEPEIEVAEVEPTESPPFQEITVASGENLVLIAEWASCSVEEIGELNEIDVRDPLRVGQVLRIPAEDEGDLRAFEMARNTFGELRLERYMAKRGGLVGVETHKVRTGETAWGISHDQAGVPTWVLSMFNRDTDLERLGIGDELRIPVLGDTVADVGETTEIGEPTPEAVEETEVEVEPMKPMPEEIEGPELIEADG